MKTRVLVVLLILFSKEINSQGLIPYYNPYGKSWGYCDFDKKSVIWTFYKEAGFFDYGAAIVKDKDYYGVINTRGTFVAEPVYKKIFPFSEGIAAVLSKEDKIGFVNWEGKVIAPCTYEFDKYYKYGFSDGRAAVSVNGKWGYIDSSGQMVISPAFNKAQKFIDSMAIVNDGSFKIVDRSGKVMADLKAYDDVDDYGEGLFCASKGKKKGYIDRTGKEVIPFNFTSVFTFSEGLAFVKKGDKMYFIDKSGKTVISLKCDEMYAVKFKNGLCPIERDDKMGYIDKTGKVVIPCKWDVARPFNTNSALVANSYEENGNFGYLAGIINKEGKVILPLKYKTAGTEEEFTNGMLSYSDKDMYGYVFVDGTDFTDTYKLYTIQPAAPPEPVAADYPKYLVGFYKNFRMTDSKGYLYQYTGGYSDKCEITDRGNGKIHLSLYIETTKEFIVNDGYAHTWSGDFDFDVTYGSLGSFVIGDSKGFILNDLSRLPGGNVDTVYGKYSIASNELTIYVKTSDDKTTMTINAKRDFTR